jgi:hypothetical protein
MSQDPRHAKVQDLANQIAAVRNSYRKAPSYFKALQIQKLTRQRNKLIADLRSEFELVVVNG